jgi:hypothetical protein
MVVKSCRTKFQKMKLSGKVGVKIKRKEILKSIIEQQRRKELKISV